ncbi:TIGR03757 family integrating conjugative element protein, partial [Salmonella enterica]
VLLDGPDQLQAEMFGELPADPQQAEAQVRQVMASSAWQQKQLQLNDSYRQVVRAWELGIKKVPAVVFDDRDVVYGTTDVDVATSLRNRGGGQ